jgi:hypothetical protein
MNTTPKQQDDEGIAAADGSRPTLDQTVVGIAPPPAAALGPASAPSGAEPPVDAAVVLVAAPTIAVADSHAPGGTDESAPRTDESARTDAMRADVPTDVGAASTRLPGSADVSPAPTVQAGLGETLPLAWSPPPAPSAEPRDLGQPSTPIASNGALDHTALSSDYLRAARETALAELAGGKTASDDSGGPSSSAVATAESASAPTAPMPIQAPQPEAPPHVATRRSMAAPFPGAPTTGAPAASRGFEPVPVVRAPLAESLSGALSPIVELGGHRHLPPSIRHRPRSTRRDMLGRWLLLASVALATVGIVTLASHLVNRYRNSPSGTRAIATAEGPAPDTRAPVVASSTATSRALMPSRPAPEPATDGRPRVVFATGAPGDTSVERATAASAGPESQLAATAGRHVLSGNYAEALPLYRELERSSPGNTAYAAMARLLEKRVGTTNDTRTISPTKQNP